ncbi:MAG TPA: hypothetical protein VN764_05350 [Polyangiaceae bacterium]|nr:hypothetical protein [Polyangiaceae bacterium]
MNAPHPPQDPPGKAAPKQGRANAGSPRTSKGTAKARRVVLTEAEIDAPNRNTLIMLGVISISTLVLWAAGRAACNYHVPGESLTPRAISMEERTRFAKDVGIEFAQALSGANFAEARTLAFGPGMQLVDEAKQNCGACTPQTKTSLPLSSTAIVHRANSVDAIVEVKTYRGKELVATRFLGIERADRKWRVTRGFADLATATLKPPPFSMVAAPGLTASADEAAPDTAGQPEGAGPVGSAAPDQAPTPVASALSSATPAPSGSAPVAPSERTPVLKLNLTGPSAPAEKPGQED